MKFLSKAGVYWRTLRHLKAIQIYWRVWLKIRPKPGVGKKALNVRERPRQFIQPIWRLGSMVAPLTWRFLNETGDLAEIGWQDTSRSLLWRYNQHYFDDLNSEPDDAKEGWHQEWIYRWIDENGVCEGVGWDAYPTSLRIVNWIKWSLRGHKNERLDASLAVQTRWLSRNLEWHILGNHLFANAKALIFAGIYFQSGEANRWVNKGLKLLNNQISDQILEDGGHFELSPMYHSIILEDVLDIINLVETYDFTARTDFQSFIARLKTVAAEMLFWLSGLIHPDGEISFFNDAAFGVGAQYSDLVKYARRLGVNVPGKPQDGVTDFSESGHVRVQKGQNVLLVDFAEIGASYLPGHAHADTLSFEMSVKGKRVFVNSGTSIYAEGSERSWQRSTGAHNTVCVGHRDSSEIWSSFRVGARARIYDRRIVEEGSHITLSASIKSFGIKKNSYSHSRKFSWQDHSLTIFDCLNSSADGISRYYLHPDLYIVMEGTQSGIVKSGSNEEICRFESYEGKVSVERSVWHPEFGVSVPSSCIVLSEWAGESSFRIFWG